MYFLFSSPVMIIVLAIRTEQLEVSHFVKFVL